MSIRIETSSGQDKASGQVRLILRMVIDESDFYFAGKDPETLGEVIDKLREEFQNRVDSWLKS